MFTIFRKNIIGTNDTNSSNGSTTQKTTSNGNEGSTTQKSTSNGNEGQAGDTSGK